MGHTDEAGLLRDTGDENSKRDCGPVEYIIRRVFTGIFYNRLYRWLAPDVPFYTPKAVHRVQELLSAHSRLFEWGSGVSTLWYAPRVSELISVEHDPVWYEQGRSALASRGMGHAKLLFSPPSLDDTYDWQHSWPYYASLGHAPRKPEFREYMARIDQYPEKYFQIIAVDGRERVGCLMHALPHLTKGGCVILDDSHRPKYAEFFTILKNWPTEIYDFGLKQTSLFFSPT